MRTVGIVDVTARDGLQSEAAVVSTADKLALIEATTAAGARRIEVCSFVDPRRVPQMADAEAVVAGLAVDGPVRYSAVVLNERGFERAAAAGLPEVNVVVVATDTFSRKNQGCDTERGVSTANAVAESARAAGISITVTVACAFGCPYEGEVPAATVAEIGRRVVDGGVDEIALADTIGVAVPTDVTARLEEMTAVISSSGRRDVGLRAHLHNTRNTGLANAVAAVAAGVDTLDASLGGIGGCPFAPKATGNVALEDLVYLLHRMGIATGLDLESLVGAVPLVERVVGGAVPGLVSKAGIFPPICAAPPTEGVARSR